MSAPDSIAPTKVSVITVCYNSESTLARSLTSVSDQDWPEIEHIVIDGNSTDNTLGIINEFRAGLTHVISEQDNGIYEAMNKGLARSSGDIVCFLNSDDWYVSNSVITRVIAKMKANNLDALLGDAGFFISSQPERLIRRYRSDRFITFGLSMGWMPAHPGLFLTKTVVDRVGRFKTDYKIAGDFEYMIRVFHNQDLAYQHFPEILVGMQLGGASTGGWRSKVELNKEVLRACRENGVKTNLFKVLSKYPIKLLDKFIR